MAIPVDLRIKKTYRALFDAFTELLEEHRFEDLTVAMLCDRAMIRRTTFYKHFRDKNDYFAFYIDELMSGLPQNSPMRPVQCLPRTCTRFGTRFWTMPWI